MLVTHTRGSNRVGEAEVMSVQAPEWTKTWHPISHGALIQSLDLAVRDQNLPAVTKREYSLSEDGARMFGAWTFGESASRGAGFALGFRNSINKTLPIGICAGASVFVCDNLCFSGEFITFRKHTGGVTLEHLVYLARKAMGKVSERIQGFGKAMSILDNYYVDPVQFRWLTHEAMVQGVVAPSSFPRFLECVDQEMELTHGYRTLNVFYQSVTRLLRGTSLFRLGKATAGLNGLVRAYFALSIEQGNEVAQEDVKAWATL